MLFGLESACEVAMMRSNYSSEATNMSYTRACCWKAQLPPFASVVELGTGLGCSALALCYLQVVVIL